MAILPAEFERRGPDLERAESTDGSLLTASGNGGSGHTRGESRSERRGGKKEGGRGRS